ncbi:MAG: NAD-dependent epimerase/dehydratase family protein [Chloroflexia bacterium]|nr:NAD-dependent epimerase/dehydratase family protein [Chloroflexia bacterium]
MRILLTGATGYLGSHLAKAFVADGHQIVALKRQTSSLHRLNGIQDQVCFYDAENIDLARPFQEQGPINAVVHTSTCYGRAGESTSQVFETNTAFPLRLLETAVFFNTDTFVNTDTILYPYLNAYSLSKKQFAEWGRKLSDSARMRFINIQLEHMYGPGDEPSKFATWVARQCLKNVERLALTSGEQRRDFIAVEDVVNAYLTIFQSLEAMKPGYSLVPVGSGRAISIRSLVEMIHCMTASNSKLDFGAIPQRASEPMESKADITWLLALGWVPRTSIDDGLKNLIADEELRMRKTSPSL